METRFKMLTKSRPEEAKELWKLAQHDADTRYRMYEYLSQRKFEKPANGSHSSDAQPKAAAPVPAETTK